MDAIPVIEKSRASLSSVDQDAREPSIQACNEGVSVRGVETVRARWPVRPFRCCLRGPRVRRCEVLAGKDQRHVTGCADDGRQSA